MSRPLITVENLSKSFNLKHKQPEGGYANFRDVMLDISKKMFKPQKSHAPSTELFWALKDVSFEVKQGDRLGIIGRNGSGKSTLLKILSRIVAPTRGRITIEGRVASLLEVGTGFHPELTGRENIFLNGAILGMSKAETKSKFDEIVDFSGVEKFLDTPVKRYSSGMYVRLAFAVAAHLEPEILIVDEVLAVGDAEFQKKCLGKMEDVSKNDGRTVIFVSHNSEAILQLCTSCLLLENGTIKKSGTPTETIDFYLSNQKVQNEIIDLTDILRPDSADFKQNARFHSIRQITNGLHFWQTNYGNPIEFQISIQILENIKELEIGIAIFTVNDFEIISSLSTDNRKLENLSKGTCTFTYSFEELKLVPGIYKLGLGLSSEKKMEDYLPNVCQFEILPSNSSAMDKTNTRRGIIIPKINAFLIN